MRHVVPVSGKDSLATAILVNYRQTLSTADFMAKLTSLGIRYNVLFDDDKFPKLEDVDEVEYIYNDVGADIPDVQQWLTDVENSVLGKPIYRIGESLEDLILDQGILPSFRSRFCTRMAKIYPMEDYLGNAPVIVYFGIRADENREGYRQTKKNIIPNYPLQVMGIDLEGVYKLIGQYAPPEFFWMRLYNEVLKHTTEDKVKRLPDHIRRQLFSWRTRMNCYFCFFQRQYEWIGLLEHYPDLFWRAVELEENTGAKDFTWNPSKSLRTMLEQSDLIISKRAKRVAKWVNGIEETDDEGMAEMINVVSCGLLCGK